MTKIFYRGSITLLLFSLSLCAQDLNLTSSSDFFKSILENLNLSVDIDMSQNEETLDLDEDEFRFMDKDNEYSAFYYNYISKYYPKAYVIRQKFLEMSPDKVADALMDIVSVFTKEPWFYFQNTPKGFKLGYYWEYVLDQCGIIHDFLKKAKVDLKSKKIFLQQSTSWWDYSSYFGDQGDKSVRKNQGLLEYLKKNHLNAYVHFFALSFDYQVKFFNEGILLKDLKQANKYFAEIEYTLEKLRDTTKEKEADYYESTKTCKRLLERLKKKLGLDKLDNEQRGLGSSNEGGSNYFKEFTELNDVV